jgi:hypothetical protein
VAENENRIGTLRLLTQRGGTVAELSQFLVDLEAAYLCLYQLDMPLTRTWPTQRDRLGRMLIQMRPLGSVSRWPLDALTPEAVLPEHRLVVTRVHIESPGFWEFLGSLNPLQQIREYLNDRHRRRQDRDFRELAERDRLVLENEIIQRQVWEHENSVLRERISIMKELGYSDEEIRQLVWASIGKPLVQLGTHQDSRLIEGVGD